MQFWNELEGKITQDGYRLGRLVRSEGRTAWFETETQDAAPQPATISLTESLTDADEVIARLQAAQHLEHPSLMAIRKIGRTRLDQTLFVYALLEHADQNLADILRGQPLSKEEARQVAEAMVSALTAIHQQGLVHGRVEPASILAIGEAVKLRSDCLQAPGGTRAGDVAGIGETLFQAFVQRKASSAEDQQINRIPAPFAEIIRNSLSSRWGLAQIAAVLKPTAGPGAAAAAAPAMPRPPIASPAASTTAAAPKPPASPVATSPAAATEARVLEDEGEEEPERATAWRFTVVYAVAGVVIVLFLGWLLLRHKSPQPAGPASSVAQNTPAPALAPAPAPTRTPAVVKPPAAVRTRPSAPQTGTATTSADRSVWRVVAYTYHHQDQAQQKADEINRDHSGLDAAAYSPPGDSQHYLVVLGGAMGRNQAFAMRDKARSAGLADDTYVQNFSQ